MGNVLIDMHGIYGPLLKLPFASLDTLGLGICTITSLIHGDSGLHEYILVQIWICC